MTKKDLFEIALKIFGLYLLTLSLDAFILTAKSSVYFFGTAADKSNDDLVYFMASAFRIVFFAFGFWLLVFKTHYLSNKLITTNAHAISSFQLTKTDMLQLLFAASGIIIAFLATSELWGSLTLAAVWDYNNINPNNRFLIYLMQIGIPISKIMLALALLIASGGLAKLFIRNKQ